MEDEHINTGQFSDITILQTELLYFNIDSSQFEDLIIHNWDLCELQWTNGSLKGSFTKLNFI